MVQHDGHNESKYAHFIGVGGAGMSALALVLAQRNIKVTGSDMKESRYTRALKAAGVEVSVGHAAEYVGNPEVVVVSTAIPESNIEYQWALDHGIQIWPRAQMLAHLAEHRRTIAVAGTHGKTSTSSMVATMLSRMGQEPSFCIGGEVDGLGCNAQSGAGSIYVVEADESDGSFVYLRPDIALITNIEADHMDHYDSIADIENIFLEFMNRVTTDGTILVCADDQRLVELARSTSRHVLTYGFAPDADFRCVITGHKGIGTQFDVLMNNEVIGSSYIATPGSHMVANACGALATAYISGLDVKEAALALGSYTGVRRRFDFVGETGGVTVVDDYGHHPTEVQATLGAAKQLDYRRLIVCFQPHRYSRTAAFESEFGEAFQSADHVVLMDVFSAGEPPVPGVSGRTIVESILHNHPYAQVAYLPHRTDVVSYLAHITRDGDLVMTMGAGDVTAIGPELVQHLKGK